MGLATNLLRPFANCVELPLVHSDTGRQFIVELNEWNHYYPVGPAHRDVFRDVCELVVGVQPLQKPAGDVRIAITFDYEAVQLMQLLYGLCPLLRRKRSTVVLWI